MFHCSNHSQPRRRILPFAQRISKRISPYRITSRETLLVAMSRYFRRSWTIAKKKKEKKRREKTNAWTTTIANQSRVERGEKRITRPKFTLLTTFSTKGEGDLLCPLFPPPFVSFEKEKQEENWEREREREGNEWWKEGGEGGEGGGRKDARIFSPPSSFPLSLPSSLCKQASLLSISFSRIAPSILRSLEPSTVIPQARRVGSRVAGWPPKEKGTGVNGVVS